MTADPVGVEERDRRMMTRVDELAAEAGRTGNTAVCTIVAQGERILAEAKEETPKGPDPFAHAELVAVRRAMAVAERRHLPGATLYINVEPCFLCSYAIREAEIGRVVIGRPTPEIGGVSSRYPLLTADDIERWGRAPEVVWVE